MNGDPFPTFPGADPEFYPMMYLPYLLSGSSGFLFILNLWRLKMAKYDYPVFEPMTEEELKDTITYKDFLKDGIDFVIKEYRKGFSIWRKSRDFKS